MPSRASDQRARSGKSHFARPMGLAMTKDGALLMADDANGVIYRIAYEGRDRRTAAAMPVPSPATSMRGQPMRRSTRKYCNYFDDVSPPLQWSPVPGARSYVVFVEDPDAKPVTPFVHWVAWNIPAGVTSLGEGLQKQPRLTSPDGVLQGRNSRESVGWFGPRPPIGDPPHHYHVEVLALDTMLDVLPVSTGTQCSPRPTDTSSAKAASWASISRMSVP